MKKKIQAGFIVSGILFLFFVLLTAAVLTVDVQPAGPEQSLVGLAEINKFIFQLFGENLFWYNVTDWLGVIAVMTAFGFALTGFIQLIKRKSFKLVDAEIITLGIFYILVILIYLFFEIVIINYRPVIIHKTAEASFPSSHTFIVLFIMSTALIKLRLTLKNRIVKMLISIVSILIIAVTVAGRLISGVHWFTDMLAGILLGSSLATMYSSVISYLKYRKSINMSDSYNQIEDC